MSAGLVSSDVSPPRLAEGHLLDVSPHGNERVSSLVSLFIRPGIPLD